MAQDECSRGVHIEDTLPAGIMSQRPQEALGKRFDRVKGHTVGPRLSRAVKVWRFVRRDAVQECLPIPGQPESIRLARDWGARDEEDRHGVEHSAKRSKRSDSFRVRHWTGDNGSYAS